MTTAISNFESRFSKPKNVPPQRIPFKVFYKKFVDPGDSMVAGIKYEFNNGIIEKTKSMKQNELFIIDNLVELFFNLGLKRTGILAQEIEVWTSETQMRKPDLAYFTKNQIHNAATKIYTTPEFVVEIISTFDPINVVTHKITEYFNAGVQVLWHIFPEQELVYVFTSPKNIVVCSGDDVCSAAPVLPTFEITANQIFTI